MEAEEQKIKPPVFPLTLAINGAVTDYYFDWFMSRHMPEGVSWVVTSKYRTPADNEKVGGAANSAHLHNLAVDFILMRGQKKLSKEETKKIYDDIVRKKWMGFTLLEPTHIHVNLSRRIGTAGSIMAISAVGILGVNIVTKLKGKFKNGGTK